VTKILASSVIRSTHRGDSHGGIYLVDIESGKSEQVVDWNNPEINWEGRGGDRGIRGLAIYYDGLYAVAGNELFVYDKNTFELLGSFPSKYLKLTHESWINWTNECLYVCAGGTDSVLIFDLKKEEWVKGWCHPRGANASHWFDPRTDEGRVTDLEGGHMHLDSVIAEDRYLYYSGAFTDKLWRIDEITGETVALQLCQGDTHNARPYRNGYLYNKSAQSITIYEEDGVLNKVWRTPHYDPASLTNTHLPGDHARQGYTRGMVTVGDQIICGTSPATINVFDFNTPGAPVSSIQLTNDIRNSICGMCLYA